MFVSSLRRLNCVLLNTLNNTFKRVITVNMSSIPSFETLAVTVPKPYIYHVELNRGKKLNAVNDKMWNEIGECFNHLNSNSDCRVVVLSASGNIFCAGLDFNSIMTLAPKLAEQDDLARKAKILADLIRHYQESLSSIERCEKPVIAAVHSACVGAGVDMITATDIRYCTTDAWFQVKEVDIGMAADVGTLQRLPKIIGSESLVRELCFTTRKLLAEEALKCGLVSKVYDNKESLMSGTLKVAEEIASKSPVAVQTTKNTLIYARDHTVQEGLDQIQRLNQFLLQSEDFTTATMAQMTKEPNVVFSKL